MSALQDGLGHDLSVTRTLSNTHTRSVVRIRLIFGLIPRYGLPTPSRPSTGFHELYYTFISTQVALVFLQVCRISPIFHLQIFIFRTSKGIGKSVIRSCSERSFRLVSRYLGSSYGLRSQLPCNWGLESRRTSIRRQVAGFRFSKR